MPIYISTDKLKNAYIGTEKIKQIYIGTDKVFASSVVVYVDNTAYNVEDEPDNSILKLKNNGDGKFYCKIKAIGSHTIKFENLDITRARVCLVAGGEKGKTGRTDGWETKGVYSSSANGGVGGKGGEVVNITGITLSENSSYSVSIGTSDNNTTGFGKTARTAYGANGGTGGDTIDDPWTGRHWTNNGQSGSNGSYAFNDASVDGIKYGAGGGGGKAGGSGAGGSGGNTGGGNGSNEFTDSPASAKGTDGTGGGGGGGCSIRVGDGHDAKAGSNGGSGTIIIQAY